MKIQLSPLNFTTRKHFPGTFGNPFDRVLHAFNAIQSISPPLYAFLLLGLSLLVSSAQWPIALAAFAFFLGDWLSLTLLPRIGKSYGPSQPPTLILALMRSLAFVLPLSYALALQFLGTLLMIYAFWFEPHQIRITHQKITYPDCNPGPPLRILHLSDLHLERITDRERILNQKIAQLKPDLILFTGDFLSLSYREDPDAIEQVRQLIEQWHAPYGIYVVSGSPAVDLPHIFPQIIHNLPIHRLENHSIIIQTHKGPLRLLGLSCTHNPALDVPRVHALLQSPAPPNCFTILLYHSPDLAPDLQHAPINLLLSGHTHGGQVRLPLFGAIFTASLYGRKLQAGRYELNNLTLYISRGIGLEGAGAPRVRFLCPPEIILWEIDASQEKQPVNSGQM